MRRLLPFFLLLAWTAPTVWAQVPAPLAEEFIETAGLERQATDFANQVIQMTQMQAAQFPEPARAPFREAFTTALSTDLVHQRLRSYITRNADEDSLRLALAWREDPLVARMQEKEIAASSDAGAQVAVQMYATTGRLGRHTVTPEQEAMVNDYLQMSGANDAGIDVFLDLIVASSRLNAMLLQTEMPPEETIRAQMRGQLAEQVEGSVRGVALYAFRDVETDELAAYAKSSDSPAARYYNRLAANAISHAVAGGLTEAGEAFVGSVEAMEARGEVDFEAWRAGVRAQMEAQQQMMAPPEAPEQGETDY